MGLLDRWLHSPKAVDAAQRLANYPPYCAPFPRPAQELSVEEARANLDYLLANRAERIEVISRWLGESGVDVARPSKDLDPKPFLRAIHIWAAREWPQLYDATIATRAVWLASDRSGRELVYSLLMDVAILLGELITAHRPKYSWSIDLDPVNESDGMLSFKRPVVQIPKGGPFPAPIILDVEAIVVSNYFRCRTSLFARVDEMTRPISDAISGARESYWLSQQQPGST